MEAPPRPPCAPCRLPARLPAAAALAALLLAAACLRADPAEPVDLRCEHRSESAGIDETRPRLSWRLESAGRAQRQTAYRILVASTPEALALGEGDLWDSGRIEGDDTLGAEYAGSPLVSRERCFWKVCVWDRDGAPQWSQPAQWSMGLLRPDEWTSEAGVGYDADRLAMNREAGADYLPPVPFLRTSFQVDRPIARATLFASALGTIEAHINGRRVSDDFFTPGWTDYGKRALYRAYDVTQWVRPGENALGAVLADGWYSGYIGFHRERDLYGKLPRARLQLHIEYKDGTSAVVGTGPSWRALAGPVEHADFLKGEAYDARRELAGWDEPGFDDSGWKPVSEGSEVHPAMQAHPGPPVRVFAELRAKTTTEVSPGTYVLDLGQNFAGVARLKVSGRPGQRITLRFAERLNPDGTIYTANLRSAESTDTYVCRGGGIETWEPRFTYHGFQYIEVSGLGGAPSVDTVVGLALGSDTPVAGSFDCSDPMLNQLRSNVYWTQRANFIDIPTDCPQRDERLGWTGDAQIYIRTATLNCDVQPFFTKWLVDLDDDGQRADGELPMVAPVKTAGDDGGPAWADAGVVCPWTIYYAYGDRRILERHYGAMCRFIAFCRDRSTPGLLPPEKYHCFGDWLNIRADTPKDVIYTAYFAYSTRLTARAAEALGKADDAARYDALYAGIKEAFNRAYVTDDGRVSGDTQTGYVLALAFDLLDGERARLAGAHLVEDIEHRGWHLSTGFIGTKDLMLVLSKIGRTDVAYRLIHSDTFPSWGFSIRQGATTTWERWDGWTPQKGFQDPHMNSFAHYSFGAVYQWMVENIGGIRSDGPSYRHIIIAPQMDGQLTRATTRYDSVRGRIETSWVRGEGRFELTVTVPANATATVFLPVEASAPDSSITEGGRPLGQAPGVGAVSREGSRARVEIGSGTYRFAVNPAGGRDAPGEPGRAK